jgi:hypothetical protein
MSTDLNIRIEKFISNFNKKIENKTNDEIMMIIQYNYKIMTSHDKLINYFCYEFREKMFLSAHHLEDIKILKLINDKFNYAPFKSFAVYFKNSVENKYYENIQFYIDNDSQLYDIYKMNEYKNSFKILINNNKCNLIKVILEKYKNKSDAKVIQQLILCSCYANEVNIAKLIIEQYNFLDNQIEQSLINLIETILRDGNLFLLTYISNIFIEKNIPIPNIDAAFLPRNEDSIKKINYVKRFALEFGYFDESIKNRLELLYTNSNTNEYRFGLYEHISFASCILDEVYIKYCLKKKILKINDNKYIIFDRLLRANKKKLFKELFLQYHSEIPNSIKENSIIIILDKKYKNKYLFDEAYDLIQTILDKSILNFDNFLFLHSENYLFVDLIRKDNLPLIKL